MPKVDILPLFPTGVGQVPNFISEDERLKIFESIKTIPHHPHLSIVGEGYSTHKKCPDFLDRDIKLRLNFAVNEYSGRYGFPPLKVSNIWSNIQNSGSRLNEHTHPDSIISGALYINVDESCKLYFHNPNPYIFFTSKTKYTEYNYEHYDMYVENCQLILFPSWLKHGKYSEVNQMDQRIVVSFNAILR